ncbi:phasin family protein [Lachnospiraceae bacterium YH-ros2226]
MADNNFLSDGIKKFFLAGVGAVATTAEKSQEIFDNLVQKGELTVEQGKALNQELRHTMEQSKENFKNASANKTASPEKTEAEACESKASEAKPSDGAESSKEVKEEKTED